MFSGWTRMQPQMTLKSPIGKRPCPLPVVPRACVLYSPTQHLTGSSLHLCTCRVLSYSSPLLCPCCLGNSREYFVGGADCLPWSGQFGE